MSTLGWIDGAWHVITFKNHRSPVKSMQLPTITVAPCGATLDHIPLIGSPGTVPNCPECLKVFVPDGPKEWRPSRPPSAPWKPEIDSMTSLFQIIIPQLKQKVNSMLDHWDSGNAAPAVQDSSLALMLKCRAMLDLPEKRKELVGFVRSAIEAAFKERPDLLWLGGYAMVFNDASPLTNDLQSIEMAVKIHKNHTMRGTLSLNIGA